MRITLLLFALCEALALYGASVAHEILEYPAEVPEQGGIEYAVLNVNLRWLSD
jgi:hypothetical protein